MPTLAVRTALVLLVAAGGVAHAAHPLISEDTGTQGTGKFELEVGSSLTVDGGGHAYEVDPQLSYGARDDLDLIVRPSFLWQSGTAAVAAGHTGFGSTALDFKWRAVRYANDVSLGVRAGVDVPTATTGFGPHEPGAHVNGLLTYDASGVIAIANVAYAHLPRDDGSGNPERRDILRVSAAYGRDVTENLRLLVDTAVARHPDPSIATWPAVVLIGAIAHTPLGFDVDVGYQARLNRAAPANVWLAGMTFHW